MTKKIKHGWNTWDNYFNVHEKVLKKYSKHFIDPFIKYKDEQVTENYYTLDIKKTELKTQNGNIVFVKIEKDIEIQKGIRKKIARTNSYTYHCWRKLSNKTADESLIRYCSPHETHNKFHHKHEDLAVPPQPCLIKTGENWPHVSEFLDEVINRF